MARQRDLQAAAQRGTVDGGDDRLAQRFQGAQLLLDRLDGVESFRASSGFAWIMVFTSPPAKNVSSRW